VATLSRIRLASLWVLQPANPQAPHRRLLFCWRYPARLFFRPPRRGSMSLGFMGFQLRCVILALLCWPTLSPCLMLAPRLLLSRRVSMVHGSGMFRAVVISRRQRGPWG
jgi:hypothetical protein